MNGRWGVTKSWTKGLWGLLVLGLLAVMIVGGCKKKTRGRGSKRSGAATTAPKQAAGFDVAAAKQTLLANPWKGIAAGKPALIVFKVSKSSKSGIWAAMTLGAEQQACYVSLDSRGYLGISTKGRPTSRGLTKLSLHTKLASPAFTSLSGKVERSHKRGFMEQSSQIGDFQLAKTDAKAIAAFYKGGCDGGDKLACYQLGSVYMRGSGVEKSGPQMVVYYKKACVLGFLPACNLLGVIYRQGELGIAKDAKKARSYWGKACDDGHPRSCVDLGNLLSKKQPKKARRYFAQACQAKFAQGCNSYAWSVVDTNKKPGAKQLAKALAAARKAVKLDPNAAYIDTLGWVYFKQEDYTRAEIEIQRALQLKPGNKEMEEHLAAIQKAMKK